MSVLGLGSAIVGLSAVGYVFLPRIAATVGAVVGILS